MKSPSDEWVDLAADIAAFWLFHMSAWLVVFGVVELALGMTERGWDTLAFGLLSLLSWKMQSLVVGQFRGWRDDLDQQRPDADGEDGQS
jgi:hypothetical protein